MKDTSARGSVKGHDKTLRVNTDSKTWTVASRCLRISYHPHLNTASRPTAAQRLPNLLHRTRPRLLLNGLLLLRRRAHRRCALAHALLLLRVRRRGRQIGRRVLKLGLRRRRRSNDFAELVRAAATLVAGRLLLLLLRRAASAVGARCEPRRLARLAHARLGGRGRRGLRGV